MRSEHKSHFCLHASRPFQNGCPRESKLVHTLRSMKFAWALVFPRGRYLTPPGYFANGSRSKTGSLELIIFIHHANFWTNDEFERFENCHHNLILEQRWQSLPMKPQQYLVDSSQRFEQLFLRAVFWMFYALSSCSCVPKFLLTVEWGANYRPGPNSGQSDRLLNYMY